MDDELRELSCLVQKVAVDVSSILKRLEHPGPVQEWFSIKDAAKIVGLSNDHVRRAVTGADLACSNVGTPDRPLYRISRTDLGEYMEQRKSGALPRQRKKRTLPHSRFFRPSKSRKLLDERG